MTRSLRCATALLMAGTTAATAGGLDRAGNDYGLLFEPGNTAQLSFGSVSPNVSGRYPAALGGGTSGDMAGDYVLPSASVKLEITDRVALALYANRPYGADADYTAGFYDGLNAHWESRSTSVVLAYQLDRITVYGGARQVTSEAVIGLPDQLIRAGLARAGAAGNAGAGALAAGAPAGSLAYTARAESDSQAGLIAGAAFQIPDIALRVGLTWEQGVTHSFDTTETLAAAGIVGAGSVTDIEIPDAWTLDFQTGIAPRTLLFGQVRHADWSVWEVRPAAYDGLFGRNVTEIDAPVTTYQIGVGRQFTDAVSGFVRARYEASDGNVANRLLPTDGTTGFAVGGTYTMDSAELSVGVEYLRPGDAETEDGVVFEGNDALAVGLSIKTLF